MAFRRIIEVSGVDLQRLAQVDLGTRAAARFAHEFPLDPDVGRQLYNIMLAKIREKTPVVNLSKSPTSPHPPGALRKSIKGYKIGGTTQWYWLAYGSILVRGNPAHTIEPDAGRSMGLSARYVGATYAVNKLGMSHVRFRAPRPALRFFPGGGGLGTALPFATFRQSVNHPEVPPVQFVRAAIRESQQEINLVLEDYGRKTIRLIREVPGFEEFDWAMA